MTPSRIAATLPRIIETQRPVFLWGAPGIGKSSVVRQVAKAMKREIVDVRATLLDPVDLRGVPKVNKDVTVWCPPAFLPKSGTGVLFLDELGQAPPMVQSACLQLILDRRIGEYELPDGWSVIAASNRMEDRAGVNRIISPLLNRFIHLDLDIDLEEWEQWALGASIIPEVRAFLRYKPALLFDFNAAANPRSFASPRSWHFLSDVFPTIDPVDHIPVTNGCVGKGPASEFLAFVQIYRELPALEAILANPKGHAVPTAPSVLYALCGALLEKVKGIMAGGKQDLTSEYTDFVLRMPDEFAMMAMRDFLKLFNTKASHANVQKWIADMRKKGIFSL